MDQHLINLIVGLIVAIAGVVANKSKKSKDADSPQTVRNTPTNSPDSEELTEADRRYREVQEEVRRRIAQKNQNAPSQPAMVKPNPEQNYKRSRQSTDPIPMNREFGSRKPKKAASPPMLPTTTMTMDAIPVMANAPAAPAMPDYPSEAAAYALPKDSGDNAASSNTSPGGSNALRAILASPNAARQAYLLREIFAQPLGLRPLASGGHEDWN